MKVLAITVGGIEDGSTKFRLGQYLPLLKERGVDVELIHRDRVSADTVAAARTADAVLIQKSLFRVGLERRIRSAAKPVVFDFDDAVWTRPGRPYSLLTRLRLHRRLHYWLRSADLVLAANKVLSGYARRFSSKVRTLPMGIDTNAWCPDPRANRVSERFTVGWAGSPGNLRYLADVAPHLAELAAGADPIRVRIYCGKRPNFDFPFDYVPYTPGTEAAFVRTLDLGLLPLPDTEHARGKSPIKSLQYLACGVPVMGNFVGAAREICRPEFAVPVPSSALWGGCIRAWARRRETLREMGAAGRRFVEKHHALTECGMRLADMLKELCADRERTA
ncbi:MAG: glycosyltransferase family 4 protein [Kiritimatiellaeota bacterium]|nr:glycosyltransferase family 4 protein [Kiritimatiellota bacterium]